MLSEIALISPEWMNMHAQTFGSIKRESHPLIDPEIKSLLKLELAIIGTHWKHLIVLQPVLKAILSRRYELKEWIES